MSQPRTADSVLRILDEAKSWLRTPFRMGAGIKGEGVDCFRFIEGVYRAAGIVDSVDVLEFSNYPTDWFLHCREEVYREGLDRYCMQVVTPHPGDVALFKFGRVYSHAAIVFEWPSLLIHAWRNGVEWIDGSQGPLANRSPLFYSPYESLL